GIDADDIAGARCGEGVARGIFQDIETAQLVEEHPDDIAEARGIDADVTGGCDTVDAGAAGDDGKEIEVAHIESAVVPGNGCRHNMSFGGRDIDHAADSAPGGDAVELAVVGFDGIQVVADGDHAVPGAIGFEVGRVGIRYGVGLLEGAEVRDLRPAMVGIYTDYTVRDAGDAMRTAGAGQDTIEGIADEGDVGDAGDQGALCRGGLAGGQVIDPGRPYAAGANTGDARSGVAAGIRSYGR